MTTYKDFPRELGALGLTIRLKRIVDRMTHDARGLYRDLGLEIEPNWHAVLMLIEQCPDIGVAEIARRLGLTHPSISTLVGQIVDRGFLRLSDHPADGRRRTVELTPKAKRQLPELKKVWEAGERAINELLRDAESDVLASVSDFEDAMAAQSFSERTLRVLEGARRVSKK